MNKNSWETAPKLPVRWDVRLLQQQEKFQILAITVEQDDKIELHDNPNDVAFYVLEGTATLEVDGIIERTVAHDTFYIPSGHLREWKNTGKGTLKLLVFKVI